MANLKAEIAKHPPEERTFAEQVGREQGHFKKLGYSGQLKKPSTRSVRMPKMGRGR